MLAIQKFANKNVDKTITVKRSADFIRYKKQVMQLTESVKHLIPDIHLRGFKTFHIDHKISIMHGFLNNLPIEQIAHIDNLRLIPAKENLRKGIKCVS